MANAHEQIDTLITTNTLKDFLTSAMQDEMFAAGGTLDFQHLQSRQPRNPLAHLKQPQAYNLDKVFAEIYGGRKGAKGATRGFGALGGAMALAPALQELLYRGMGLDPSGLEDEEPWFNPEGSSYETKYPPIPQRIESIPPKDINFR